MHNYTIYSRVCQERVKKMNDTEELTALKAMIEQTVRDCTDAELLDLILKLLLQEAAEV